MRQKLFIAALFGIIIVIVLALLFFWQRQNRVLGAKNLAPYFAPDPVSSLVSQLEKVGMVPQSSPTVSGDTISASISAVRVLFAKDTNFETQVRALQLVLPRLKMEGRQITEVDLRFSKVVIR